MLMRIKILNLWTFRLQTEPKKTTQKKRQILDKESSESLDDVNLT